MIRFSAIVAVIALYFIPFYKSCLVSQKNRWNDNTRATPLPSYRSGGEAFYQEGFVNGEKPHTICHVSSIAPLSNNKIACTWYAGSREGSRDVSVYFSTYDETLRKWTAPRIIVDRNTCSKELKRYVKKIANAALFRDKKDRLWLFFASMFAGGWSGSSINYKISTDGGVTWSKAEKMILSPFFNLSNNVKNSAVHLDDDTFLVPAYHEFINKFPQQIWIRSNDGAVEYRIHKMMPGELKMIQPSIIHDRDTTFMAFFRNTDEANRRFIRMSKSSDMGMTWSDATDTVLPNPNAGFDTVKLINGNYFAVINNSFSDRSNLSIVLSKDTGKSWKVLRIVEQKQEMEYSYPSVSRSLSGLYHVTYTWEKRRIKHLSFNDAWIQSLDDAAHE